MYVAPFLSANCKFYLAYSQAFIIKNINLKNKKFNLLETNILDTHMYAFLTYKFSRFFEYVETV